MIFSNKKSGVDKINFIFTFAWLLFPVNFLFIEVLVTVKPLSKSTDHIYFLVRITVIFFCFNFLVFSRFSVFLGNKVSYF